MNDVTLPVQSTKTLIKSGIAAIFIAGILLVLIILPAEYNIDPTGIGNTLGLTAFTEAKPIHKTSLPFREDTTVVVVPAKGSIEYKFYLEQYEKLSFEWIAEGAPLYFDFHGEPENDTTGFFESYIIAENFQTHGTVTVPFSGVHGWYWENDSNMPVTVKLKTKGRYNVIGAIH